MPCNRTEGESRHGMRKFLALATSWHKNQSLFSAYLTYKDVRKQSHAAVSVHSGANPKRRWCNADRCVPFCYCTLKLVVALPETVLMVPTALT